VADWPPEAGRKAAEEWLADGQSLTTDGHSPGWQARRGGGVSFGFGQSLQRGGLPKAKNGGTNLAWGGKRV